MTTSKDRHGDHKCKLDLICPHCVKNHMMERDELLGYVKEIACLLFFTNKQLSMCKEDSDLYNSTRAREIIKARNLLKKLGYAKELGLEE